MPIFAFAPITRHFFARIVISTLLPLTAASAEMPETIAAPGEALVARLHAEGAQIYSCKPDASGKLVWQFREPLPRCSTATRPSAGTMPVRAGS